MSLLRDIKKKFAVPLRDLTDNVPAMLEMIRPSQDDKFGDYQVNCAMPLQKIVGKPPREIAQQIVDNVALDGLCSNIEIAGPGFINLTISDDLLKRMLTIAVADDRLGVEKTPEPKKYVIDYSSPNVAKPMHVGHIRSTVIGDALTKILRFAGHVVISDNHLGDWGTQFGMIIYGYKNFVDEQKFASSPIEELLRLYRLVRGIADFHQTKSSIPQLQSELQELENTLAELQAADTPSEKAAAKKHRQKIGQLDKKIKELKSKLHGDKQEGATGMLANVETIENDKHTLELYDQHRDIDDQVLLETAKLHAGDQENLELWKQFLPLCRKDIQRIYNRLDIEFDYELGESFYHDQLECVVNSLETNDLATTSDGATCVFLDGFDAPMIVRKRDGAFLYSTSDLATIKYRAEHWNPDIVLYVVDHRQHEHFAKLFAAARLWGFDKVEFHHVSFGTIMGEDGRPFQTRAGDTVGLEGLLDEAVARAHSIVCDNDDSKPGGAELSESERRDISQVVGIGALKYADLSQNRSSDYVFSYEKMVALKGNTATYLQYCYARVQGILRKENTHSDTIRTNPVEFQFAKPIERKLSLVLLRFSEAIDEVPSDYKPNILANYLFELAETFFTFYDQCSVKDAETEALRSSRLQLCDLVGRTIKLGLSLLGIGVVNKM